MTATFGTATTGSFVVSAGSILVDGAACGGATVTTTDTIVVDGDPLDEEELTIDLSGGPFAPGAFDETGASDEIEFDVNLDTGFAVPELIIDGTAAADHITIGQLNAVFPTPSVTRVNLNANETDGIDYDVEFDRLAISEVYGEGGNDVLDAGGGDGTGDPGMLASLYGGDDEDELTVTQNTDAWGEEGNDVLRTATDGWGGFNYDTFGTGPVELTLQDGTGLAPGGGTATGKDGFGDTDTFFGAVGNIGGSNDPAGDILNGGPNAELISGNGGNDAINGGGLGDLLLGGSGIDTIRGDAGRDQIEGGTGNDVIHGDGDNDVLLGNLGDDDEFGDDGDDQLSESGRGMFTSEANNPNGADLLSGGPGVDTVQYGEPQTGLNGNFAARTGAVSVDADGADGDDGAPGEGDSVQTDVENLVGGDGDDTLVGNDAANVLRGLAGRDTLRGRGGADILEGLGVTGFNAPDIEDDVEDGADDIDGEGGPDLINANDGGDSIEAREGTADTLNCGPGIDSGRGDSLDTINADCEGIALPVDMPADPPLSPPSDPPANPTPPPSPPAPPGPAPPGAAPPLAQLVSLPSTRRCASRRKFRVRVRSTIVGQITRVTIFINGKRVKTVTGSRLGLPVDLRGLPKGKVKVKLRVALADGRVRTDTRTYRTCATKKRKGRFGGG